MKLSVRRRRAFRPRRNPDGPTSELLAKRAELAARGEQVAVDHLEAMGLRIVERNWEDRHGELDIVAWDSARRELVIVEVRTFRREGRLRPEDTVDHRKQVQVIATARRFLARSPYQKCPVRVDVIGVVLQEGTTTLRHHENAFEVDRMTRNTTFC